MVTLGATAVGAHLVHRLPIEVSHTVSLLGGITVIVGLVTAFGTLATMLFENVYLAMRDDSLLLHDNGKETVIPWDDLGAVTVDAPNGVVELRRANDKVLRWYAGKGAKDVAARLEDARRKGRHGILRTGSNPPSNPPPAS